MNKGVTVTCKICNQPFHVPISDHQILRWGSGELIQNVAPELSVDQRELLISGICGKCFDGMFPEGE